jgi:hypothetical protein
MTVDGQNLRLRGSMCPGSAGWCAPRDRLSDALANRGGLGDGIRSTPAVIAALLLPAGPAVLKAHAGLAGH